MQPPCQGFVPVISRGVELAMLADEDTDNQDARQDGNAGHTLIICLADKRAGLLARRISGRLQVFSRLS